MVKIRQFIKNELITSKFENTSVLKKIDLSGNNMSVSIDILFRFIYGLFSVSWASLEDLSLDGCSLDSKFANCLDGGLEKCFNDVLTRLKGVDKKYGLNSFIPSLKLRSLNVANNFSMEEFSAKVMFEAFLNYAG
jgi:hypothetical protein